MFFHSALLCFRLAFATQLSCARHLLALLRRHQMPDVADDLCKQEREDRSARSDTFWHPTPCIKRGLDNFWHSNAMYQTSAVRSGCSKSHECIKLQWHGPNVPNLTNLMPLINATQSGRDRRPHSAFVLPIAMKEEAPSRCSPTRGHIIHYLVRGGTRHGLVH